MSTLRLSACSLDGRIANSICNLRRFSAAKRSAIVICFLQAARAEMTDGIVEMQDKLITSIHNKARKRYEDLLRATEEARSRAVEVLEELGTVVLDDSIPDHEVRQSIFKLLPIDDISRLVEGCRNLRAGGDGSTNLQSPNERLLSFFWIPWCHKSDV
jgi:hypothetical protein